jgi:hypothetical protein
LFDVVSAVMKAQTSVYAVCLLVMLVGCGSPRLGT